MRSPTRRIFLSLAGLLLGILIGAAGVKAATDDQLAAATLIDRNQFVVGHAIGPREWDNPDGRAYIRAVLGEGP